MIYCLVLVILIIFLSLSINSTILINVYMYVNVKMIAAETFHEWGEREIKETILG
jgi:hypothetical protein